MTRIRLPLAVACLAAALFVANLAMAEAVLTQVSGAVEIGRGEPANWTVARSGDVVAIDDRVRTGADGRVEIKMDAGTLRVHENSLLRLPAAVAGADQVELDKGRSLFDVLRRDGRRFEVHTPTVVVSVKGTRFGVDAGQDIGEVTVYRGTVGVREAGASEMVETLVREGFLATGGVGVPVELDVSSVSDPWQRWQQFDRAQDDPQRMPRREGEMDRAKSLLHRTTTADVIEKAAARRPEVAERLDEIKKQRGEKNAGNGKGVDGTRVGVPTLVPTAPDLTGDKGKLTEREILRERLGEEAKGVSIEDLRRDAIEAKQVRDDARTGSRLESERTMDFSDPASLVGSSTTSLQLNFPALYDISPLAVVIARDALLDIQAQVQSGAFVPTSPADVMSELQNALVTNGLSPTEAFIAVQALSGL